MPKARVTLREDKGASSLNEIGQLKLSDYSLGNVSSNLNYESSKREKVHFEEDHINVMPKLVVGPPMI